MQADPGGKFGLPSTAVLTSVTMTPQGSFPAMRHRIILNFEAQAEGITTDEVINRLLESLPSKPDQVRE
jgi:hypothetical protein